MTPTIVAVLVLLSFFAGVAVGRLYQIILHYEKREK